MGLIIEIRSTRYPLFQNKKALCRPGNHLSGYFLDHPLKNDIKTVIRLNLCGLEVFLNGNAECIHYLSCLRYDKKLCISRIGSTSLFLNIRSDVFSFNAVMVCTTNGIMFAADFIPATLTPKARLAKPMLF